jgi:protein ImuB
VVVNRILGLWRHAMRRVISLYLPHWPTDRLRRASKDAPPRDKPLVTAMMQGQRRVIASVDQAAASLDLTSGMTVTHAQSLIPDLEVVDATPEEDEAALLRLGLWCIRYSPLVTPNPPDGVFIDVAGSAHLFQGEGALIADLCKRLKSDGIAAKAALADTAGCAWALARYGDEQIVSPGRAADAIASLPVASLRLAPSTVTSLADVGIERVAQLASKPRGSLRTRFGGEVLLRLDQALGNANEPLPSLLPPEVPRTELRFAEPVGDPDDLKRIIEKLADKLCLDLEARGIGARRLDLVFIRVDNIAQAARIGLSRPYREPKHLAKLLAERLVVIDPGLGIETVTSAPIKRSMKFRNSSIRLAFASAKETSFVSLRSKVFCPNASCAVSRPCIRRKGWPGPKICRGPRDSSSTPKRLKRWRSYPIIRPGFSSGARRGIAWPRPMALSAFMANGG